MLGMPGALVFEPWNGPRSRHLEVVARAGDPEGDWVYRARKIQGVADSAVNAIAGEYSQVDHIIFLKKFGGATSLARWARLLGFQWEGAMGNAWDGAIQYPSVLGLNRRMSALGLQGGFTFVPTESEITHLEYAEYIQDRRVVVASSDQYHFHDMFTHVLAEAMYTPEFVERIRAQLTLLLRLRRCAIEMDDPALKEFVEANIIRFMKVRDRHATFMPALVLPKDDLPTERVRLWMVDLTERLLLSLARSVHPGVVVNAVRAAFIAMESTLIVEGDSYLGPTFRWLENRDFDLRTYFNLSQTLAEGPNALMRALIAEARLKGPELSTALRGAVQKMGWPEEQGSAPPHVASQAVLEALRLQWRIRTRLRSLLPRRRAMSKHAAP